MALNGISWTAWLSSPPVVCAAIVLGAFLIGELLVFLLSPPPGTKKRTSLAAVPGGVRTSALVSVGAASQADPTDGYPAPALSPTDRAALRRLKQRVVDGDVAEGPTESQRFKFARWQVSRGRYSEWDVPD